MKVNTNIASLSAQRYLSQTTKALARAMQRLASGQRISSARDDAAGTAIADRLNASIRGLRMNLQNINAGQSMIQVADSALATQLDLIQRMREIAIQAATGTLSTADRHSLGAEIDELYKEYQRIVSSTTFGNKNLLNGLSGDSSIQVGLNKGEEIELTFEDASDSKAFQRNHSTGQFLPTSLSFSAEATGWISPVYFEDFNGDGAKDILSIGSTQLSVRLNDGTGHYGEAQVSTISTAVNSSFSHINDFNGDGILDLAAGIAGNSSLYLGTGDGHFSFAGPLQASAGLGADFGDLDGDGDVDYIYQDWFSSFYQVMLNNGSGTFSVGPQVSIAATVSDIFAGLNGTRSFALGDIDGDGDLDLGVQVLANQIEIWKNDGAASFSHFQTIASNESVQLLKDLNEDGRADIVTSSGVRLAAANGTMGNLTSLPNSSLYTLGEDIDNDGDIDLVNFSGSVFLNDGQGAFTRAAPTTLSGATTGLGLGDVDGDGFVDLLQLESSQLKVFTPKTELRFNVSDIGVKSQNQASQFLNILDNARDYISGLRAQLGAQSNRLESAANSQMLTAENLSQARSTILDADYAETMAEFVKQQILQQAQISTLSSANVQMQIVLQLLK